jgi:hypothetical protein
LAFYKALWPDQAAALGPNHPDTLATQRRIGVLERIVSELRAQHETPGSDDPDGPEGSANGQLQ